MSASRAFRRASLLVLAACAVVAVAPVSLTSVGAVTTRVDHLRVGFDTDAPAGSSLAAGAVITDASGMGNNGVVMTEFGGSVKIVAGAAGVAASFPAKCSNEPCANALVRMPHNASLNPLMADFEWGARIKLKSTETDDGENVLQKGTWDEVGGEWKLQVDKAGGYPSCLVSGQVPGQTTYRRVVLKASVGVANGVWHSVTCRRTAAAGVEILVDGVVRGTAAMPVVMMNSIAPLTIGAKTVDVRDNDQFHGLIDDVFMTVMDSGMANPPNGTPTASFAPSCFDLTCTFDASTSTDDGPVLYDWDFGDGATGTGVTATHTFAAVGEHTVTLTVTDGQSASDQLAQTLTLPDNVQPSAAFTSSCTNLACSFDGSTSTDTGPLTYAWDFGDGTTGSGVTAPHYYLAGGDYSVTLTVTDAFAATSSVVHPLSVTQPTLSVAFVSRTSVSGAMANFTTNIPTTVQPGDALLMFLSVGTAATVKSSTVLNGWVPVATAAGSTGSTRLWKKVATATDAGAQVKINLTASSKGNVTIVAYRGTSTIDPVAGFARQVVTTSSAVRTTPITSVASPTLVVSYWMHRDGTTTALVPPAGVTARATGTQTGTGHVTVLTADSGTPVAAGPYGGLQATAAANSTLATTWTIVLAPA